MKQTLYFIPQRVYNIDEMIKIYLKRYKNMRRSIYIITETIRNPEVRGIRKPVSVVWSENINEHNWKVCKSRA